MVAVGMSDCFKVSVLGLKAGPGGCPMARLGRRATCPVIGLSCGCISVV